MDETHKEILRTNRVFIVEHLTDVPTVLDNLLEANVFTAEMVERIEVQPTRTEKVRNILNDLPRRGPKAYATFIKALQQTSQDHIIDKLSEPGKMDFMEGAPPPSFQLASHQNYTNSAYANATLGYATLGYGMQVSEANDQTQTQPVSPTLPPSVIQPQMQRRADRECYNTGHSPGRLLCINNMNFTRTAGAPNVELKPRTGANYDSEKIKQTFEELGFRNNNKFYENLSADGMKRAIAEFVDEEDTARASSVVFVVSSHGEKDGIYGSDCKLLTEKEIIDGFDSTKDFLKNKPKLLIFQACRRIDPISSTVHDGVDGDEMDSGIVEHDAAVHARRHKREDMAIARATVEGDYAMRNTREGSWFITAICNVLRNKSRTLHVLELFTEVNNEVRKKANASCIQIPALESTLSKSWFLVPDGS